MKKNLTPLVLSHDPVWAIEQQRGMFLWEQLKSIDADVHRAEFELAKAQGAFDLEARRGDSEGEDKPYDMRGSVAIISVAGPMMKAESSFSSNASTVRLRRLVRSAANDKDVKSILLRFDSPGGSVSGTQDLADEIAAANRKKECVAYIEDCCCSAAYWCATQCTEIYANRTAVVGSIGTYMVISDYSRLYENAGIDVHLISTGKHKGAGAYGSRITPEQVEHFQQTVDSLNEHFLSAVATGRNMTRDRLAEFADGRVWIGSEAEEIGLVDGIAAWDDVLLSMQKGTGRKSIVNASTENDFTSQDALPVGATAEQTLESVLAAVEGVNDRFESIRGIRAKQGRTLSADRVRRLKSIRSELDSLIGRCEALPVAEDETLAASETPASTPEAADQPDEPATESQCDPDFEALIQAGNVAALSLT